MSEIRNFFKNSSTLNRLIVANLLVFAIVSVAEVLFRMFQSSIPVKEIFGSYLAVPSSVDTLLVRPWTIFTYMFVHFDFLHILFNMLWLYWFGQILAEYLGEKKLWATYVLGGLAGALLYIIAFNTIPLYMPSVHSSYAIGASAGIMAIVVATATLLPNYTVNLMFLGPVAIKYIAMVYIFLDVISLAGGNAGGHVAHLGGALFGFVFIRQLRRGNDLSLWFVKLSDFVKNIFKRRRLKVVYHDTTVKKKPVTDEQFNTRKKAKQEVIDQILDKISKSGYDSLSKEEKDILFRASKE